MGSAALFREILAGREFASITEFARALTAFRAETGIHFVVSRKELIPNRTPGLAIDYLCKSQPCSAWFRLKPIENIFKVTSYCADHDHWFHGMWRHFKKSIHQHPNSVHFVKKNQHYWLYTRDWPRTYWFFVVSHEHIAGSVPSLCYHYWHFYPN